MKRIKICDVSEQIRGVSYKPTDIHAELNKNSVILLRANNISDGKINFDEVVYVDKSKVSKKQYLKKGDILICASSGSKQLVGKAASVNFDVECTFGAFCKVVRPCEGFSDYLGVYFQSDIYRRRISELSLGANINNIKNEHIDLLEIPLCDETETGKFVHSISKVQEIIDNRKQQLQQLDDLVKARFVEMFGNRGENPYNFPTTTMGNVYKFQYGKGNNIPEDKGEYPCYGSNGVVGHHTEYNSEDSPIIGHIGAYAGIVNWGKGKHYVTYNGVICKLINDQVNPVYGYYLLQLQDYNAVAKSGAAQPFVSYKDLDAPVVNVPPMEVQNQFAAFVEQVDKSKVAVQKALDEAQTLFDSLMQEYFG